MVGGQEGKLEALRKAGGKTFLMATAINFIIFAGAKLQHAPLGLAFITFENPIRAFWMFYAIYIFSAASWFGLIHTERLLELKKSVRAFRVRAFVRHFPTFFDKFCIQHDVGGAQEAHFYNIQESDWQENGVYFFEKAKRNGPFALMSDKKPDRRLTYYAVKDVVHGVGIDSDYPSGLREERVVNKYVMSHLFSVGLKIYSWFYYALCNRESYLVVFPAFYFLATALIPWVFTDSFSVDHVSITPSLIDVLQGMSQVVEACFAKQ